MRTARLVSHLELAQDLQQLGRLRVAPPDNNVHAESAGRAAATLEGDLREHGRGGYAAAAGMSNDIGAWDAAAGLGNRSSQALKPPCAGSLGAPSFS